MLRLKTMLHKARLYFDTVKYLRPIQLIGQITKARKLKRSFETMQHYPVKVFPLHIYVEELDGGETYLQRFDAEAILHGEIELLHERHCLDLKDWQIEASALWRFNLHYFEYGIALAMAYRKTGRKQFYDCYKKMLISWIRVHEKPEEDAWHPYTISLRIPNWIIAFEIFGSVFQDDVAFKKQVFSSLYRQYRTLLLRQETWNLGNHYLENIKASLLGSILFHEADVFETQWNLWMKELQEQILPDGFHFELSPMYHKIVLEDLLRVAVALKTTHEEKYLAMKPYVQKMLNAAVFMEHGCQRTLLFNDSGNNVARPLRSLSKACQEELGLYPETIDALVDAGYYRLQSDDLVLVVDLGIAGPNYIPGHSHCDCMSYELFYKGEPLFINMGTGLYQGALRSFFRSTRAHNTVVINGHEQSECWAEHRLARRLSLGSVEFSPREVAGSYRNYLGEQHRRKLKLSGNKLCILDCADVDDEVVVESFLHVAPEYMVREEKECIEIYEGTKCIGKITPIECAYEIGNQPYAPEFGHIEQAKVLMFRWCGSGSHGYIVNFGM